MWFCRGYKANSSKARKAKSTPKVSLTGLENGQWSSYKDDQFIFIMAVVFFIKFFSCALKLIVIYSGARRKNRDNVQPLLAIFLAGNGFWAIVIGAAQEWNYEARICNIFTAPKWCKMHEMNFHLQGWFSTSDWLIRAPNLALESLKIRSRKFRIDFNVNFSTLPEAWVTKTTKISKMALKKGPKENQKGPKKVN